MPSQKERRASEALRLPCLHSRLSAAFILLGSKARAATFTAQFLMEFQSSGSRRAKLATSTSNKLTLSGTSDSTTCELLNVAVPTASSSAANKHYVDARVLDDMQPPNVGYTFGAQASEGDTSLTTSSAVVHNGWVGGTIFIGTARLGVVASISSTSSFTLASPGVPEDGVVDSGVAFQIGALSYFTSSYSEGHTGAMEVASTSFVTAALVSTYVYTPDGTYMGKVDAVNTGTPSITLDSELENDVAVNSGVYHFHGITRITTDRETSRGSYPSIAIGTGLDAEEYRLGSTVTAGYSNIAIGGFSAEQLTLGYKNTAVGTRALSALTIGAENTAMGASALGSKANNLSMTLSQAVSSTGSQTVNVDASSNVLPGMALFHDGTQVATADTGTPAPSSTSITANFTTTLSSGSALTVGDNPSVAVGCEALSQETFGGLNVAVGTKACQQATTARWGVTMGYQAASALTTGDYATCLGYNAASSLTTGSNNVVVGASANVSTGAAANQIVIGQGATGQGDNYAVIGNANVTRLYAAQDGGADVYANSIINSSDRRLKEEIEALPLGLAWVQQLQPVQFRWKDGRQGGKRSLGLVAQDVVAALESSGLDPTAYSAVAQDDDEQQTYRLDYTQVLMPLISAVQELSARVQALERAAA